MHCKMETNDGWREMSDTLSEREMMREDGGVEARMEAGGWRLLRCDQERQTTTTNKRQARMNGLDDKEKIMRKQGMRLYHVLNVRSPE